MRRLAPAFALLLLLLLPAAADAQRPTLGLGAPELEDTSCADRTYADCKRMRFAYGPYRVGTGANENLIEFGVAKPGFDGYVTRMSANLYYTDGTIPRVDIVHLHHGVWVSTRALGNSLPFFGAGEEKTTLSVPSGYGMKVLGSDTWGLNHMLHNLTRIPRDVYVTWDIDYIPAESAEAQGIRPVVPLWLDIMSRERPIYPVFNVQKGFGARNARTGRRECTYPRRRCALFDPYGRDQRANGKGWDWLVPNEFTGTLVGGGGHVHPGGLRIDLDVVRGSAAKRIFTSEAVYFDRGGPISWDLSMTVTPPDWRVQIRPGDKLRLNATYDSDRASWYEGMGIMQMFVSPGETTGPDPFTTPVKTTGDITHGHLEENDFHGGGNKRALPRKAGRRTSRVRINNFRFAPGDLSTAGRTGIPRVKAGGRLTFTNRESNEDLWHTITSCAPPCTGETGISYPLANSLPAFDSLNLGYSRDHFLTQAAAGTDNFTIQPKKDGLKVGKTYTYFCRVHPFMRGAFKVVK